MKIIKDKNQLRNPIASKQLSADEVDEITTILKVEHERHGGIGLSANQIGLDVRACIIDVIEPLVLINPRITKKSDETVAYAEQCLSDDKSMKKPVKTVRHKTITIETDNLGTIEFGPSYVEGRPWKSADEFFSDKGLLECVCVQHEIDHLDGILMTDKSRRYSTTIIVPKKYGRNEKVMIQTPEGETEFMKYKKAIPFLEMGCTII